MNLALTILKFFGIAISVISGVLGTLSRTHEEKTIYPIIIGGETRTERKLTRSGKVYLLFICLGGIFAVGALVGESLKKQRDDAEARSLAEQQIRQLKEALKRLDNLTPLGLIDISATYEIPTNLFWANKLLQSVAPQSARLQRLAATLSPTETPEAISLFVVPRSPYRNVSRLPLRILPDGRDVKWDTEDNRSLGVAGIKAFSNDTTVLLYYNSDESFFGLQSGEIPGATHYVHGTNVESTGGPHPLDHGAHKISATFADCCHFYFCLTVIHSALFNPLEKRERAVPGTARPPFPFSQGSQLYRRRRSVFKPFALAGLVIK